MKMHIPQCSGGGLVTKSCLTLANPWTVAYQVPLSRDSPGKHTGCAEKLFIVYLKFQFKWVGVLHIYLLNLATLCISERD